METAGIVSNRLPGGNFYLLRVSKYSLAQGSEAYCRGEMALFEEDNTTVFAQAVTDVICLAFLIAGNEEKLLASNQFLLLICKNIAGKLGLIRGKRAKAL